MTAQEEENTVPAEEGDNRRNSPRHSVDCRKTRARRTFRQKDVTRALRATIAAGMEVQRIDFEDGKFSLFTGKLPESPPGGGDDNEWDTGT
jgi:hypothetical protein